MSSRFRGSKRAAVAVIAAGVAVLVPSWALGGAEEQRLSTASDTSKAEKVKTIPITKRSGQKPRVVLSLSPGDVGTVNTGDEVWVGAEFEVSVTCLERIPQCVGKIYKFSPQYRARAVLAGGPNITSKDASVPLTDWKRQKCSQDLPHRNHHCVLTLAEGTQIPNRVDMPCQRCYVNVVVEAYHRGAKSGNVLVVGSDEDNGISQNKASIGIGVFSPGPADKGQVLRTRRPQRKKVPIGGGSNGPRQVIYSQRVNGLREGEQLLIDVKGLQKISQHPYSVLMQSQVVVADKASSTKRAGVAAKVTSNGGVVTAQNGFNCTQGASGHKSPCAIRKAGVIRLIRNAVTKPLANDGEGKGPPVPLYVNLVVQNRQVGIRGGWRPGDATKLKKKGGYIEVRRYGPEYRGR